MTYTRDQLITALVNDYAQLCAEDPSSDDLTPDAYVTNISAYTDEQLLRECCVDFDDDFTVDDYISLHT